MNIIKYYQLLLFLCILSIYYNFFLSIFRFDFIKIKSIEIVNQIKYNAGTDTNTTTDSIPTFIASLKNNPNCKIDSQNEIQMSNIKKNIKSKKNYYVFVIGTDDKKNICSRAINIFEIIIRYISFYVSTVILSIITASVIIEYFLIFNNGEYSDKQIPINEYWNRVISDEAIFDGAVPDGAIFDGVVSDGAISDGAVSDGAVSDGAVYDGAMSDDEDYIYV